MTAHSFLTLAFLLGTSLTAPSAGLLNVAAPPRGFVLKTRACEPSTTEKRVLFATHHKTGTLLAQQVANCLRRKHPELLINLTNHFEGKGAEDFDNVLHFVRNPVNLVVSAYIYHKEVGERWGEWRGSARSIINTTFMGLGEFELEEKETYNHFLNRVPEEHGLLTELRRFLRPPSYPGQVSTFGHPALQIRSAHDYCVSKPSAKQRKQCAAFCLDNFMQNSEAFMAQWREALEPLGICLDHDNEKPLRTCLDTADVHSENFKNHQLHITEKSIPEERKHKYKNLVRDLDSSRHSRTIGKLEETLGC